MVSDAALLPNVTIKITPCQFEKLRIERNDASERQLGGTCFRESVQGRSEPIAEIIGFLYGTPPLELRLFLDMNPAVDFAEGKDHHVTGCRDAIPWHQAGNSVTSGAVHRDRSTPEYLRALDAAKTVCGMAVTKYQQSHWKPSPTPAPAEMAQPQLSRCYSEGITR